MRKENNNALRSVAFICNVITFTQTENYVMREDFYQIAVNELY